MKKNILFASVLVVVSAMVWGFLHKDTLREAIFARQKSLRNASLPQALPYQAFQTPSAVSPDTPLPTVPGRALYARNRVALPQYSPLENTAPQRGEEWPRSHTDIEPPVVSNVEPLPDAIDLAVPFTPQAPHANWNLPYQEACEEASLLMVARYKNGKHISSPEDADDEIRKLVAFQEKFLGYYKDTTAEETAEVARVYYGFKESFVKYDFTVDDVKREIAAGNPVIIPAAGRILPNPYFRSPGPLYHMLVIRGYTKDSFITNDPGTKRGEAFVYRYDEVLGAAHDWNGGEVATGRRAIIVVK